MVPVPGLPSWLPTRTERLSDIRRRNPQPYRARRTAPIIDADLATLRVG